ncbi:SAM-dependent methyltransferase [Metabacillus fastidiosus]|uniref:SAM-dependent methyltransferase n=1 Tax=Metabacillus fastidiosus TaxID=1458 RepID=A0ABU6NX08_9BACI|nr:SAM-dependent methyltransferase [Metabacillus fastidiosus]MED4400922.1 SAM-dependent methyltransferase [Metabacillus fastidiosus]MED4463848.1 SAM-dependent methyltransferase [Metabacillus fastidiosus]
MKKAEKYLIDVFEEHGRKMTYADYIDLVLYNEQYGYYSSSNEKIGRKGDFYTTSSLSPFFAKIFAKMFVRLVELELIKPCFCEIGGGNGQFIHTFLKEWERLSPHTFKLLQVFVIERSVYHLQLQKQFTNCSIEFLSSIDMLEEEFEGIIFSNELFDAFPVHVIEKRKNLLYEVFVTLNDHHQIVEEKQLLNNEEIIQYLKWQQFNLYENQRMEIPLKMLDFMKQMNKKLRRGLIISIDYGYTNKEWMQPVHRDGSLRGYYKHQLINSPLQYPFQMDLTTHIHIDGYKAMARELEWQEVIHNKQNEFLIKADILSFLNNHEDTDPFSKVSKDNRAIRSLIMAGGISAGFDVLMHCKGIKLSQSQLFNKNE